MHAVQWEAISQEVGPGRTPAACLSRYQKTHNKQLLSSK